jgi:hypothetical protein
MAGFMADTINRSLLIEVLMPVVFPLLLAATA